MTGPRISGPSVFCVVCRKPVTPQDTKFQTGKCIHCNGNGGDLMPDAFDGRWFSCFSCAGTGRTWRHLGCSLEVK